MRGFGLFIGSAFIVAALGCGDSGTTAASGSGSGGNVTGSSSGSGSGGQNNSSSASSVGNSSGSGIICVTAADCPGKDNICAQKTCDNNLCGLKLLLDKMPVPSQVYGDCKATKCDGKGTLGIEDDDMDVYDDGNVCTVDTCSAGVASNMPATAGTMCGDVANPKVCDMKGACVQCAGDMDCAANVNAPKCSQGKCVPATCVDAVKNGTETGIDCGGTACAPCADGGACKIAADCQNGVCTGPINNKTCQKATCGDGTLNGTETDVDCGGADCVPMGGVCDDSGHCKLGTDCKSSVCKAGICQPATCADGVQNSTEKGTDCGGPCPTTCP